MPFTKSGARTASAPRWTRWTWSVRRASPSSRLPPFANGATATTSTSSIPRATWTSPSRRSASSCDGDTGENGREEAVPADLIEEAWQHRHDLVEKLADYDDHIAELFLDGKDREVTAEMMKPIIRRVTIELKATPVFIGS